MNLNVIKVLVLHNSPPAPWCIVQVACVEILIFLWIPLTLRGSRGFLCLGECSGSVPGSSSYRGLDSLEQAASNGISFLLYTLNWKCLLVSHQQTEAGTWGFKYGRYMFFLSMVLILGTWKFIVNRYSRTYVAVLSGPHLNRSHCNVLFPQSYQLCKLKLYLSRD